tara:strand:- start:4945 stop:6147 length:1203 start_codon:yes stop_codon:yes gene_type:complete
MYTRKNLPTSQYELSKGVENKAFGRSNDTRRDDDKIKDLKIGLYDLDYCIKWYFDNTIKPRVDDFGRVAEVPVVYGGGEKWKQVQEDGYLRDIGGKVLKPIISYRRTNVAKNRNLGNKVDANFPQLYGSQEVKYNASNRYDQFSKITNLKPERTFVNTVIPEYVDITYEIVVWTDFIEHMNSIVESILYTEGTYWGDEERFKFRTKIDDFTNTTDQMADADRVIRTTFTLTLFGYIVPDVLVKHLSKKLADKTRSVQQLNIELNVDADDSVFTETQSEGVGASVDTTTGVQVESSPVPLNVEIPAATLTFLGTNVSVLATSQTSDTAIFPGSFLTAPSGLPATSKNDFIFFINGVNCEPAAISNFIDNGDNTCTTTFNVSELGFTIAATDEVVATGKFNI